MTANNNIPLAAGKGPDWEKWERLNAEFLKKNRAQRPTPEQPHHRRFWQAIRERNPDLDLWLTGQGKNLDALPEPMDRETLYRFLGTIIRPEFRPLVEQVFQWIVVKLANSDRLEVLASDLEELANLGILDQLLSRRGVPNE